MMLMMLMILRFCRRWLFIQQKGFTQAADVLFAKNPALRHPQTRVRVTRFASDKSGDTYLDDRLLQGPLVKVFQQTFEILLQHVRWETRFQSGDVRRTDRPDYPFEALREGLVNAFAHRDYSGFSGGVTVGIYPHWSSWRKRACSCVLVKGRAPFTVELTGHDPDIERS